MIRGILEAFGLFERRINIGFNHDRSGKHNHGKIAMRKPGGSVETLPFVVDRPDYLEAPTWALIDSLFEQARRLGFEPLVIEFKNKTRHMAYKYGQIRPVLAVSLK